MNSMERIGAALSGAAPDRRPYTLTLSLYGSRLAGIPTEIYYADPERYAEGQRAVVRLCAPDVLFGPFSLALEAAAFGAELHRPPDGAPTLKRPPYRSAADGPALPDSASDRSLRYLTDAVRALAADQGGSRPVAAPIASPTDLPVLLMGLEAWLETLLFDPPGRQAWYDAMAEHFRALAAAYFAAGAAFLVCPVMLANPTLVDPGLAGATLLPLLRDAFSGLGGPVVFHHGGNRLGPYLHLFKDLPNLAGFVLDERDSFAEARELLGPQVLLLGNLSGPHCSRRSPEEVGRRAAELLEDRRGDGKFILAGSGADVPYDTDPAVIEAVARAAADAPW